MAVHLYSGRDVMSSLMRFIGSKGALPKFWFSCWASRDLMYWFHSCSSSFASLTSLWYTPQRDIPIYSMQSDVFLRRSPFFGIKKKVHPSLHYSSLLPMRLSLVARVINCHLFPQSTEECVKLFPSVEPFQTLIVGNSVSYKLDNFVANKQ